MSKKYLHPTSEDYRNKYKDDPLWKMIEGYVMQAIYSFVLRNFKGYPKKKIDYTDAYTATRYIFSRINEEQMKWTDTLLTADTLMTQEARRIGKARITINYYADRNGVVRKFMEQGGLETQECYDKGELDD